MHGDALSHEHDEEPLEPLPGGPDPLLDEHARVMAERIQTAARDFSPEQLDKEAYVTAAVKGAAGGEWNIWPDGGRGGCLGRLVVVVNEDHSVIPALRYALDHVGRCCRYRTTLVMFVLSAPHPSWRAAWLAFRQEYARQCPQVALRVEVFGHPRLCFFDAWGRPVSAASERGNGICPWWQNAQPAQRELFRKRIRLLERLGVAQRATCAYKHLHTGQPGGDFQDLSFGTYQIATQRITNWCARVYLNHTAQSLPTGFPRQVISANVVHGAVVWGTAQANGPGQPWIDNGMANFKNNPAALIDATALIQRLP
jgi:hypothetical protein